MELENFSSLIELSAALNVAFVAIEYAKSFTKGVVKHFFNFHNLIEKRARICLQKLYDEPTIENIQPVTFANGKNTEGQLNESRRKYNKLRKDIESSQQRLCDEVDNMCSSKCLPTSCLFIFLFNITQLFFLAFTPESPFLGSDYSSFFICSFSFLTVLTFIFLFFSWFSELRGWQAEKFCSLRYAGIVYMVCIILSFILGYLSLLYHFIFTSDIIVVFSILLTFINLVIVLFLLHKKGKSAKRDIENQYKALDTDCDDHNRDIERHMHSQELEINSERETVISSSIDG